MSKDEEIRRLGQVLAQREEESKALNQSRAEIVSLVLSWVYVERRVAADGTALDWIEGGAQVGVRKARSRA